jgi:hypothetical protein
VDAAGGAALPAGDPVVVAASREAVLGQVLRTGTQIAAR